MDTLASNTSGNPTAAKRRGGPIGTFLRAILVLLFWVPIPCAVGLCFYISSLAQSVPAVPDLDEIEFPPEAARLYTADGWQIAGPPIFDKSVPPQLQAAFLAAEDEDFFVHRAFNTRSILRAALANYTSGKTVQGASTISQQFALRYMTREKTIQRKVSQLILARRLEATYGKRRILDLYLNTVFLGPHADGVNNAAWQYFQKRTDKLTLGESALLAGITPAPSRYNPHVDPNAALKRRDLVLDRMSQLGMISSSEHDRAKTTPITFTKPSNPDDAIANLWRHQLSENFDSKTPWLDAGSISTSPLDPGLQKRAERALRKGLLSHDKRQGYRGPIGKATKQFDEMTTDQTSELRLARVTSVTTTTVTVWASGETLSLQLADSRWASPSDKPRHFKKPAYLSDFNDILSINDVVFIRRTNDSWRLSQSPKFEGTVVVSDTWSGRTLASVAGRDSKRAFNNGLQGCRQPGSVFKPFVYAEGLTKGFNAASMLSDVPVEVDTGMGGTWRPRNADRDYRGYIPFARALASSRNIPTIRLTEDVGIANVVQRAKKFGIKSPIKTSSAAALGASCLRPIEINRAFSAFQRNGRGAKTNSEGRLTHGADIFADQFSFHDGGLKLGHRLDRIAEITEREARALSEKHTWVMLHLLRNVVVTGTAYEIPKSWKIGGKTGTTNKWDGWFVGFDGQLTTVVWLGDERNKTPLGKGEHGATVAMPIFADFYEPFASLEGELFNTEREDTEFVRVDPETGLRARDEEYGWSLPFVIGTAPQELTAPKGAKQAERLDELLSEN